MKYTLKSVSSLAATLVTFGSFAGGANAALTFTIDEYTTDAITLTLSGTFDADTIGDASNNGYLAFKNDWKNNSGVHTELFSGLPTISLNTVTFGGFAPDQTQVQNSIDPYNDSLFFVNPFGEGSPILAGTEVSGSIRLTGVGFFDPSDAATLELVSGFVNPFGPGVGADWARLEASAVPEPYSAALLGLGVFALALRRSRH